MPVEEESTHVHVTVSSQFYTCHLPGSAINKKEEQPAHSFAPIRPFADVFPDLVEDGAGALIDDGTISHTTHQGWTDAPNLGFIRFVILTCCWKKTKIIIRRRRRRKRLDPAHPTF
jgi:hypothetical protein